MIVKRKAVHGAALIFAKEKNGESRMSLVVDLRVRNEITIKDNETIPNQIMIVNSLGRLRY